MVEKTVASKQRRAADTARWRERLHCSGRYERVVATRRRQARWRAQVREGRAIFKLELPHDRAIEALIVSRRLSEEAAIACFLKPLARRVRARNPCSSPPFRDGPVPIPVPI